MSLLSEPRNTDKEKTVIPDGDPHAHLHMLQQSHSVKFSGVSEAAYNAHKLADAEQDNDRKAQY